MLPMPMEMLRFTRKSFQMDVDYLKNNMWGDDIADLKALSGHTPEQALQFGLDNSDPCITFFWPGEPERVLGMGGIVRPYVVWLLFSKQFFQSKEERKYFLQSCPLVKQWLLDNSPHGFLFNQTRPQSRRIRHWLKFIGAKELNPQEKVAPILFYIRNKEDIHV